MWSTKEFIIHQIKTEANKKYFLYSTYISIYFQLESYKEAQDSAKKSHSNIWEYGDITEDDAKEFGLGKCKYSTQHFYSIINFRHDFRKHQTTSGNLKFYILSQKETFVFL